MRDSCKRRGPHELLPASAPHQTTCNSTTDVIACASTDTRHLSSELNRVFSIRSWACEGMHHVLLQIVRMQVRRCRRRHRPPVINSGTQTWHFTGPKKGQGSCVHATDLLPQGRAGFHEHMRPDVLDPFVVIMMSSVLLPSLIGSKFDMQSSLTSIK
jgi:hypothetical protein